ncbi:MCE family protein [Pseudonocardia spinosispora]|uniref:MCE family protein n=1 Tax=Pseudonocardia spinosispora TaxID=103441 RepID=UPI000415F5D4|nr:MCE family protein [Pseudonocardia spinosispora]
MPFVVDATGRGEPLGALARRGAIALVLVIAVVAALLMQYKGVFRSVVPVTAMVASVGDGVQTGADVKLRGVLVGTVSDVRVAKDAQGHTAHAIDLALRPDKAAGIPANVTARVIPTNIFGAPSVELLDQPQPTTRVLASGATIPGDTSAQTLQLQTVLSQLNQLLRSAHPAELNVALTNISQAIQGRGPQVNSIISRLDNYLTTINAHSDDLSANIKLLGTSLQGLADASPALLDTVDNAVVTSRTIVEKRQQLADSLVGGADVTHDLDGFVREHSDELNTVFDNFSPITAILAAENGKGITRALDQLGVGTGLLAGALQQNEANGLALQIGLTPFSTYTSADCPRYPGLSGPNCGGSTKGQDHKIPDIPFLPTPGSGSGSGR